MTKSFSASITTDRVRANNNLFARLAQVAIPVSFLLVVVFFTTQTDTFLSFDNAQNVMRQSAVLAIAAIGLSVVLISGGIDISQGAVMVAAGLVAIEAANSGLPDLVCLALALAIGAAIGFVNGFFAELIGVPALMATLGVALMVRGFAFVLTEGRSRSTDAGRGDLFETLGRGEVLGIPSPFAIAAAAALVTGVALRFTVWGRHTYAIGGNPDAARAVGVRVSRHRWWAYVFGGTTSALAGVVMSGRLGSASPNAAATMEFDVITAVVLGGVSIFGGIGGVGRVLVAALFLATLSNGLIQIDVPAFWERVVTGGVFLIALSLDRLGRPRVGGA